MSVKSKIKSTEDTIIKKKSVSAAVSSWIGEDEKNVGKKAEEAFPIENRPSRLGIGAKFLAHKDAVTTSAAETGLKRIINRDQEDKKRKHSEVEDKKVPEIEDDEEEDSKVKSIQKKEKPDLASAIQSEMKKKKRKKKKQKKNDTTVENTEKETPNKVETISSTSEKKIETQETKNVKTLEALPDFIPLPKKSSTNENTKQPIKTDLVSTTQSEKKQKKNDTVENAEKETTNQVETDLGKPDSVSNTQSETMKKKRKRKNQKKSETNTVENTEKETANKVEIVSSTSEKKIETQETKNVKTLEALPDFIPLPKKSSTNEQETTGELSSNIPKHVMKVGRTKIKIYADGRVKRKSRSKKKNLKRDKRPSDKKPSFQVMDSNKEQSNESK